MENGEKMGYRILVTGSRDWTDDERIEGAIREAWRDAGKPPIETVTLIHGCARGADSIAASIARKVGMTIEAYPAAWDTRGRAAGVIRNSKMVNAGADICLAFIKDQSRGASHCSQAAMDAGIETRIFNERTETR